MIKKTVPAFMGNWDEPLVSVVLPVYNGEKYLVEAIDSILVQTFASFEVIMIDDGSTDGSLQILRSYEQRDSRVRVIARENRGLATTLNDSIDIARGKWIARMDQDDIALPVRFERQLAWLEKTGADISGSWAQRFGSLDKRVVELRQSDEAIKTEMLFTCPFVHPTVMMRTSLARGLRYDLAWEKAEDYDLWERAAEAGWKMTNVPEILLKYRVHGSQISTATSARQWELGLQIQRRYWKYYLNIAQVDQSGVDELLKICGQEDVLPNMDKVDAILMHLLQHSHGERREALLAQVTRLYLRVAADCPNVISRWRNFFPKLKWYMALSIKMKLWLLRMFRVRTDDSKAFLFLRKLYIALKR